MDVGIEGPKTPKEGLEQSDDSSPRVRTLPDLCVFGRVGFRWAK